MLVTGFNLDVKVESVYATQKAEKTEDNGEIKDYIIVAKNEKAYNRALNATGEESIKNGEKFIDNNIIVAELSEQEAEELNEDSNIIIEEDLKVKANVKAKPRTISKNKGIDRDVAWNLQMINADKANINSNQKVKVAIIDSGVDAISGIKVKERINLVDDKEDNLLFFEDYSGHGTSVAGIKDRISRFPWPSYADTNWEKSLIVFGMALHVIGDAYAHKAYGYQNGAYVNINHTDNWNTNADNTTYFAERELGARSSTIKAMKRYFDTGTVGNYKQFVHNNYSTYKLHKLYTYCNKTTESEGGSVASDATLLRNASYGD